MSDSLSSAQFFSGSLSASVLADGGAFFLSGPSDASSGKALDCGPGAARYASLALVVRGRTDLAPDVVRQRILRLLRELLGRVVLELVHLLAVQLALQLALAAAR